MKEDIENPFFSIVLPTSDKPELIDYCLYSIEQQVFTDYEVILSDNYVNKKCNKIVEKYTNIRIKYINPDHHLGMNKNWEFALQYTRGKYVIFMGDKYMLYPDALQKIFEMSLDNDSPDIINWWSDGTQPENVSNITDLGSQSVRYRPIVLGVKKPEMYSPSIEIRRRRDEAGFGNLEREKGLYFRGKLYNGAFSKTLIDKILGENKSLFPPCNPDFTSLALGLKYADRCLDICDYLGMYIAVKGNGSVMHSRKGEKVRFLKGNGGYKYRECFPIPNLYMSTYNLVAWDFYTGDNTDIDNQNFDGLNFNRLINNINNEFYSQVWDSEQQKNEQNSILNSYINIHNIDIVKDNVKKSGIKRSVIEILDYLKLLPILKLILRPEITASRFEIYHIASQYRSQKRTWNTFLFLRYFL